MLFGLRDRRPLLDEVSAAWMFDVYDWALRNFDPVVFRDETVLVTPSNEHFPGRATSPEEMAGLIFERVVGYAGMAHWPLRLLPPGSCMLEPATDARVMAGRRGARVPVVETPGAGLTLSYDAESLNNPEAMIAVFAHALAHYLATSVAEPPPGDTGNWPQVTELLAVFLGFGLMFANTALVLPRGGCCGGPVVRREAYVSQHDITYALAIFATLKGLSSKAVLPHLKKSLRGHLRHAMREINGRHAARVRALERYFETPTGRAGSEAPRRETR